MAIAKLPNTSDRNQSNLVDNDYPMGVSTISDNYHVTTITNSGNRINSTQSYMEMENPNDGSSSNIKANVKKCFHSCQTLPTKTRQTLKILLIGAISILALIAIFFLVRLPAQTFKNDKTVLIHQEEEYLKFDYEVKRNPMNEDHNAQMFKIIKDSNGKAKQFGQSERKRIPLVPLLDVERLTAKRTRWHLANESEVEATLDIVRVRLDADRKNIVDKELRFWVPGVEPLRVLLVSTWRSGSTFLGQLLQAHPGVFQHYEPLSHLGVTQVRSGKQAFLAQQLIHRLLDCDYERSVDYMNYTRAHMEQIISQNTPIWEACKAGPNKMACIDQNFLTESCQMFPIQLVKTVRLRLNLTQLLLNDEKLRTKVIFLVRDPRGIMSSRYSSVKWCEQSTDCISPKVLCQDMDGDLKVSSVFEKLYPKRFLKVMYEELATNTLSEVGRILSFLGLELTPSLKLYLEEHTTVDKDSPWSTQRKSPERVNLWKKNLSSSQVREIEISCGKVLKSLDLEVI